MRKLCVALQWTLLFLLVNSKASLAQQTCQIKYDLSGFTDINSVEIYGPNEQYFLSKNLIDSCQFQLDEPDRAYMIINETQRELFYVHEGTLNITTFDDNILYDSKLNQDFQNLMNLRESMNTVTDTFLNRLRQNETFDQDRLMSIFYETEKLYLINEYYYNYSDPSSFLNLQLLSFLIRSNNEDFDLISLFQNLDSSLFSYPSYKLIKWSLDNRLDIEPYEQGDILMNDTIIDMNNITYCLNDLIEQNKYLYIDFWTTDCPGTKIYRQGLSEIENEFNSEVKFISICAETDWDLIQKMNDEAGVSWATYSCLGGDLNPLFKKFKIINSISGFLIDENGTIVLANSHPSNLDYSLKRIIEN